MSTKKTFGVVAAKKEQISILESKLLTAQNTVKKRLAIVSALTEKSVKIETALAESDTAKNKALQTKNLLDTVIRQVEELLTNSKGVALQTKEATSKNNEVAVTITAVTHKLIYTAEVVNKLSNLIIREKAINPLVSDELVTLVTTVDKDAINAVALTLVTLKSIFTAQSTAMSSDTIVVLENKQVAQLYESLTTSQVPEKDEVFKKNIKQCIDQTYENALTLYAGTLAASTDVAKQLHHAKADLDVAETNVSSLQAKLAAAQAAILAS